MSRETKVKWAGAEEGRSAAGPGGGVNGASRPCLFLAPREAERVGMTLALGPRISFGSTRVPVVTWLLPSTAHKFPCRSKSISSGPFHLKPVQSALSAQRLPGEKISSGHLICILIMYVFVYLLVECSSALLC